MKRIDKTKIFSTRYKKWLDQLNRDKLIHPNQSKTYYNDVMMNLLYCQKGVCAYTEMIICNPELLKKENWKNGRYKSEKVERFGSLDHFDPQLKKEKFWEWNNLFAVSLDINVKKGDQEVDDILKPDSPHYDPYKLLEYNTQTHRFLPHRDIDDKDLINRIKRMLKVLQVNHDTVCYHRKTFFNRIAWHGKVDRHPGIDCFFTAYQMAMSVKKNNQ
jgi:hypothetical protein